MRIEAIPAFVLHDRPYRETSALLEVFTSSHGRLGIVARGVRSAKPKALRAQLAPFNPILLSAFGSGELLTLTAVETAGARAALSGERLYCGIYLNELLVRLLPKHDPHPELFLLYAKILDQLSDLQNSAAWLLRCFERDLLRELGYAMRLHIDGETATALLVDTVYSYDPEFGPVLWSRRPIAPSIKGSSLLALHNNAEGDANAQNELRRLMRSLISHHIGGSMQSWKLFSKPSCG